jgi:hypothetical protein
MEWHHAHSPNKPKKFKTVLSTRKLMATIFWDRRGVLLIDFMDFYLFTKLKDFLAGIRFDSDEELKEGVTLYLNELTAEDYAAGIQKLVTRYDKCLNLLRDYVEK